ncbi:O-antigen ligase family protein [Vibrio crassostreae]|uniref:O-antigen ligase family protein n=1 Tax=Vibrio crassostreae TaxID=246167 RepID=UPI000F485A1D|nr:O-antigen ligase family protein [Vibrio crassostreae]ROO66136.1 O-antigen ligase [Vibrio crassostreae]ROP03176.1 O-antigen ligase [Vibrio crassostreae]ROQ72057.1 O-antigen ligase [Vibrio crassostreae]ROR77666.1 O-antigen ligase [Vibrio crassostreae]ROS65616.1 O-antigen ligase [Vibrio crassostreae]
MNLIKRNLSIFLILPYFIAVTGMLVLDSGDKKLIPFIILSIIMSLFLYKKEQLIKNIKLPFIWLLALLCVYTIFSYYYHGASSREMRALLGSTLFLLFFPYQILTQKVIQWIVLVGSFVVCINSIYFNLYIGIGRDAGYINPIPYATSCALISIIAFSLLLDDSPLKEKALPLMAFLLSLPPIVLSETRGIWLALILSMFFIIVVKCIKTPPSKKQILFTLIFTAILVHSGAFLFKDKVNERYNSTIYEIERIQSNDFSTSFGLRLQMWMLAPKLIKQKPILGHGQEQREILKNKLRNGEISKHLYRYASAHYHNQFLDKMVKSGVVGLILAIGLLLYPLMIVKKLPSLDTYIVIGLVSLFFIAGLTDVPFNHSQTIMLYLLFIVPICSRCKRVTND